MNTEQRKRKVMEAALAEMNATPDFRITMDVDMGSLVAVVSAVQLALRHPSYRGPCAQITRKFVRSVISKVREAGYESNAEMLEMGNDPAYDDVKGREAVQ